MAQSMTLHQPATFPVGTTLTELTGDTSRAEWLVVSELADDLYLVYDTSVADGAAVPTNREVIPSGAVPVSIRIGPLGKVLVAQATSGPVTLRVTL